MTTQQPTDPPQVIALCDGLFKQFPFLSLWVALAIARWVWDRWVEWQGEK